MATVPGEGRHAILIRVFELGSASPEFTAHQGRSIRIGSLYGGVEYRFDSYAGLPDSHQTALTLGLRF